jgi:hypothetical protein
MQTDPMEEWRRLTALYGEMGDVEIRELADQINDLTPNAQQVLRDELKKRGLTNEPSNAPQAGKPEPNATVNWEPTNYTYQFSELPDENEGPHEYTWKTELCVCATSEEAQQIGEALRRAGVDSWIQGPQGRMGFGESRVLVAADQLEQARGVAAQPIPQDIIDESKESDESAPYENPTCPKCRAVDPTLESVEPSNNWLCESCGYAWSDPVADDAQRATSA